eukprot:scaffold912_cov187-Ochromonas_danica.AAC.12
MNVIAMHQVLSTEVLFEDGDKVINLKSDKRVDSEEEYEPGLKKQGKSNDSETVKSLTGGNSGQGGEHHLSVQFDGSQLFS